MLRICIDQDGVVADLHSEWLKRYNYDYNDNLKPEDIKFWNWHKITKPECQEKIYSYLDDPEIFANLAVIEDSQEVIHKLSKKYEIFFVTAPFNSNNVIAKNDWLLRHFDFIPEKNYVYARNKSIIRTDWLIDDKADNFKGLSGVGLLFDAAHNQDEKDFYRVRNWKEIEQYFEWVVEIIS